MRNRLQFVGTPQKLSQRAACKQVWFLLPLYCLRYFFFFLFGCGQILSFGSCQGIDNENMSPLNMRAKVSSLIFLVIFGKYVVNFFILNLSNLIQSEASFRKRRGSSSSWNNPIRAHQDKDQTPFIFGRFLNTSLCIKIWRHRGVQAAV